MPTPEEGLPVILSVNGFEIEVKYPQKIFWPDEHITKLELVEYYQKIAPVMMPYLKNRPVTLHYFPRGIDKVSFYKRNYSHAVPGLIDTYAYREISQDKTINVPVISGEAGIVYLASKGCIEFHSWASIIEHIEQPTWAVFDLDISVEKFFLKALEAAYILHDYLQQQGLESFVKTSGGKGLHVYVPVKTIYNYEQIRSWVKTTGQELLNRHPSLFALPGKQNKTHDTEKVVIDYRQNTITRNTASVYTVRAKSNAKVSAPVSWEEVASGKIKPEDFTLKTMPGRIEKKGDLFKNLLTLKQKIPTL